MKRTKAFLLFIAVFLLAASASAQCSMCKAVVETDGESGGGILHGINHGILYLLVTPYILLMLFFRKRIFTFLRELRGLWK